MVQNLKLALARLGPHALVGPDGNRIDGADVQFARDDHGGHQAPARHGHDGAPVGPVQAPGQGSGVAMQLVPADMETFFVGQAVDHGVPFQWRRISDRPSNPIASPATRSIQNLAA